MRLSIPYGKSEAFFEVPEERLLFRGEMPRVPALEDLEGAILQKLDAPEGTLSLAELAEGKRNAWLFAWGCRAVGILENWPKILIGRGLEAGLEYDELMTLVNNVSKYGTGDR